MCRGSGEEIQSAPDIYKQTRQVHTTTPPYDPAFVAILGPTYPQKSNNTCANSAIFMAGQLANHLVAGPPDTPFFWVIY